MVAVADTRALQYEFQGIAMTIAAVTAANNSGHSTLIPSHEDGSHSLHGMLDMRDSQVALPVVSKAIASLLV